MPTKKDKGRLRPFMKWPGGKEKELPVIERCMPASVGRYFEPFVGGGAVFLALGIDESFVNDKSHDLMSLYRCVAARPRDLERALREVYAVFTGMEKVVADNLPELEAMRGDCHAGKDVSGRVRALVDGYVGGKAPIPAHLLDEGHLRDELARCLNAKMKRMCKLEQKQGMLCDSDRADNYECGLKSGVYMAMRRVYNAGAGGNVGDVDYVAAFYFVREFCYSSMFRYNAKGEFNVPYGGISYNRKDFDGKIRYLTSKGLSDAIGHATLAEDDFEAFLDAHRPVAGDFVFVDPPYDSDFSTYDQNSFDRADQERLANWLASTEANVMVVIKRTDFIHDLYASRGFRIASFDKKYQVSFKDRNDRDVTHLVITNYDIEAATDAAADAGAGAGAAGTGAGQTAG